MDFNFNHKDTENDDVQPNTAKPQDSSSAPVEPTAYNDATQTPATAAAQEQAPVQDTIPPQAQGTTPQAQGTTPPPQAFDSYEQWRNSMQQSDSAQASDASAKQPFVSYAQWRSEMQQQNQQQNQQPSDSAQSQNTAPQQDFPSYEQWRSSAADQNPTHNQVPNEGNFDTYEQWRSSTMDQVAPTVGQSYSAYEQWQQQQMTQQAEPTTKKNHKRLAIAVGSVAACLLVMAGVAIGSGLGSGTSTGGSSIYNSSAVDPSKPSVTVTDMPSSTNTTTEEGMTGEQIYEKVSPSVVSVVSSSLTSQEQASGSGVIMSSDGYVITNHHVIADAQKVTILTSDGIQYNVEVVGSDETSDLAVLKVTDANGATFQAAEFGDSTQIKAGQRSYAIGSPGGVELANTITTGSISAISRDITIDDRVMTLIQTDASINPGNSGGALINPYGQVIGITSAKLGISYYEGLGFAIPIDSAKEIVNQLIQNGYVPGRPAIGISGSDLSAEVAAYNNVPQGVLIRAIDSRSNAAQAGVQVNDIITAVNGKTITTMNEVNEAKGDLKAGDTITLTIYRISTGKSMDVSITLADQHDLQSESTTTTTTTDNQSGNSQYGYGGGNSGGSNSDGSSYFTFPW